jgi:Ulp1 family protease
MIDFDIVQRDLLGRHINLFDLDFEDFNQRGINHLGIIFNTDTSNGSGIHWIAMQIFWDIKTKKGEINFFDSAGSSHTIPFSILKLMKHLQSKYKQQGYNFITQVNKTNHQREDSECGVYSVYFLIFTLFNSYSDMNNNVIDDSTIHMFRDILWV